LSRRTCSERNGERGFTLIEAVVALALVAVVLAAIGAMVSANLRGVRGLEEHAALMQAARLIAAELPRKGEPLPDVVEGDMSGYRWQLRLSPFFDTDQVAQDDSRFIPERLELQVRSPSGAMVSLETVRLQNRSDRQ
jgi:general secretion pathway protein I